MPMIFSTHCHLLRSEKESARRRAKLVSQLEDFMVVGPVILGNG